MSRIGEIWSKLEARQRLIAVLAVVAIGAAVYGVAQTASTPRMVTLYAGLDQRAAGEVLSMVESMGVNVETRGASVLVPASERDRLRLALAAEGLPRNGPAGYELLDGVDGFGTTSEMFEATYWRAKEGELARTILAAPGVRDARVHIANPVTRPFQRAAEPSASVTVTSNYGAIEPAAAEAIRYLVASAVAGLQPRNVSVIDAAYGAVLRSGEDGGGMAAGRTPGGAREAELRQEVERLLAARVGAGRAIVSVSVDATRESERVTERVIDPETRVVISSDSRSETEASTGTINAGGATVASNLPQAEDGAGESTANREQTEERLNYEVSQTTRERIIPAGEVQRLTVAVLVDGVRIPDASGAAAWSPRPQEELDQLRDLVRAAVGFDEARGDVVTVETLEFAPRPEGSTAVSSGFAKFMNDYAVTLVQMGLFSILALGLAAFVLRPLLTPREETVTEDEAEGPLLPWTGDLEPVEEDDGQADRIAQLRSTFTDRREESATVLRGWLEQDVQAAAEAEGRRL